ncbi:MAG TPA: glycosyltransferase [Bryocella sp.]|nr:glycosyltransferase [Bryocella sp.]
MKVLQLGKFYFPEVGGIETALKHLCESLADQVEFQVLVANTCRRTEHEQGRVCVTRAASAGKLFSCSMAPSYPLWARRFDADLIHVHLANPLAELSGLLANPDVPVVAHFHSDVVRPLPGPLRVVYNRFLHAFYRRANCVVVPTPRHIEVSDFVPFYRAKCRVVPFGIPLERFELLKNNEEKVQDLKDDLPTVLFVGRLVHYKGVEFLIRAMENVNARLWIVGTGPLEESLKQLSAKLGIAGRVLFLGHVSDDDLVAYYHACDVFALPSITNQEMFGLVQLEAMACRKPVVASDLPTGVSWVNQHAKTGYCVAPGNPAELASALRRLLSSRDLREEMGAAARDRVEQQFSSARMGEAMLQVYRDVLSESYARRPVEELETAVNLSTD